MAVDTRNKRASCIGLDVHSLRVYPDPDGTVEQTDRVQLGAKYASVFSTGIKSNFMLMGVS